MRETTQYPTDETNGGKFLCTLSIWLFSLYNFRVICSLKLINMKPSVQSRHIDILPAFQVKVSDFAACPAGPGFLHNFTGRTGLLSGMHFSPFCTSLLGARCKSLPSITTTLGTTNPHLAHGGNAATCALWILCYCGYSQDGQTLTTTP